MTRGTLLHLIDTGGPGGAETVYLRVAAGLEAHGWRAVTVIHREDWLARQLREFGIDPVILDAQGSFNFRYLRRLTELVREHRADALLTHLYGSAIYGALAGRLARRPVVSVLHGQSDIGAGERFGKLKARIVASGASHLVAVSTPLRDALAAKITAPLERWEVIPNGVNLERLKPGGSIGLRQRLGVGAETLLVGALGNIRKPKAYDVFLRTAARLVVDSDRYRFVIAGQGTGSPMDELLAMRAALGLERSVEFLGMVDDIPGYMGDLDVFLLTSATEGFSIACVEAMACGLPVVATRSGGPEDIVANAKTGLLCPVGDDAALADAVRKLANTPVLRQAMGAAGRERAIEQYSLSSMLDRYARVIAAATSPVGQR